MHYLKIKVLQFLTKFYDSIFEKNRLKLGIYYRILRESRTSYAVFGIGGILIYGSFAVLDIYLEEHIEFITLKIRLVIIALCSFVFPITRKKLTSRKIGILNLITFAILLLETEIQFNGSIPFWDINTWFATVIFLIFCSFFFLGRPRNYLLFLVCYLIYYFSRTIYLVGNLIEHEKNIEIISSYLYIFATVLLSFLLNIYWFRVRYTNLMNNHLTKINQIRVVAMERNIAALQERENIFMDIHDHLGGKILECYLTLSQMLEVQKFEDKQIFSIQEKLLHIRYSIRNRMRTIEEIDLISENLSLGLEFLINSRYANANKKIKMDFTKEFTETLKSYQPNLKFVRNLYFFISELINNDLQYGIEIPNWIFDSEHTKLSIVLTNRIKILEFTGMGTENLLQRINLLEGHYANSIDKDGGFFGSAVIPLLSNGQSQNQKMESPLHN